MGLRQGDTRCSHGAVIKLSLSPKSKRGNYSAGVRAEIVIVTDYLYYSPVLYLLIPVSKLQHIFLSFRVTFNITYIYSSFCKVFSRYTQ
jgi:hypothetical protein